MTFGDFKVEIRRGPAPDTNKTSTLLLSATARAAKLQQDEKLMQSQIKAMEDEAARQDKNTAEYRKAMSVIAKLNAQLRAAKLMNAGNMMDEAAAARKKDPDATDYHAIIPINDYPQKARWKVTNKETMSQVRFGPLLDSYSVLTIICIAHRSHGRLRDQQGYLLRTWKRTSAGWPTEVALADRVQRRVQGTFPLYSHSSLLTILPRSNKLCEKSNDCSSKHRQRQCKQKFAVLIKLQVAIAYSRGFFNQSGCISYQLMSPFDYG